MVNIPDVIPAFLARRQALFADLATARAEATKTQLSEAIFVSEVVAATIYDLQQTLSSSNEDLRKQVELHSEQAKSGLGKLAEATENLQANQPGIDRSLAMIQAAVATLQTRSALQISEAEILRSKLLQTMCLAWLELMETYFKSDDRAVFWARVKALFEYGSTKLPMIGDLLELVMTALDIYSIREKCAKMGDDYMFSLESYFDAGNRLLAGIVTFCEGSDSLLAGRSSPAPEQIQQRIREHIEAVSSRTHPMSKQGGT